MFSPGLTRAARQMSTLSLTPEVTKTSWTVLMPLRAASPRIASSASLMPDDGAYPFFPSRMALWTASIR